MFRRSSPLLNFAPTRPDACRDLDVWITPSGTFSSRSAASIRRGPHDWRASKAATPGLGDWDAMSATMRSTRSDGLESRNMPRTKGSVAARKSSRIDVRRGSKGPLANTSINVSAPTTATTRSGAARAASSTIGPPNECPMSTTSVSSRASTTATTSSANRAMLQSCRESPESPCPARSSVTTVYSSASSPT